MTKRSAHAVSQLRGARDHSGRRRRRARHARESATEALLFTVPQDGAAQSPTIHLRRARRIAILALSFRWWFNPPGKRSPRADSLSFSSDGRYLLSSSILAPPFLLDCAAD
jgi:hypothetical protein